MEQLFVKEIVIVLFLGLVGGIIAIKLKQPTHLGYLFAGILLSLPVFSDLVNFDVSRNLAQVGVALLLFTTGLEFPISKLLAIKKTVIISSILQMFLFILFASLLLSAFGFTKFQALFLSAAFSNSATVLILQIFEKSNKLGTKIKENVIQWLVLQDIAMVLIAVLINVFSTQGGINISDILLTIAKSIVFILISVVLAKGVIPKIFDEVSKVDSYEILLIISFCFCMIVAYFAEIMGLSYTLGAFLAGVMISESFVNHEIFSEVKPLRDLFSVLFYVTLGSLLSVSFLTGNILTILLILIALMLLKFITTFLLMVIFEKQSRTAFLVGLSLVQGGEFAFILSQIGYNNQWIDKEFYSLIIIVNILSLFLAPLLIKNAESWFYSVRSFIRKRSPRLYRKIFIQMDRVVDIDQPDIQDHIVICGYGRVGSYIGRALIKAEIPFIVIDSSTDTIDYCKKRNIKAIFGDASNLNVLEKADVERARALVIALPVESSAEIIASNARKLKPTIKILARSHIPTEDFKLKEKGVNITVEPEFEAAVSLSKKILNFYGRSPFNISKYLKKSRRRQRSKNHK